MRLLPLHSLAIVALLGTGNALGAEDIGRRRERMPRGSGRHAAARLL